MFAYCGNNPVSRLDPTGKSWFTDLVDKVIEGMKKNSGKEDNRGDGANLENMLSFFGVTSKDDLPVMADNCMVFMENISSYTFGSITIVIGRTIVMNEDKYCTYTFAGTSRGVGLFPIDKLVTKGYVYGVENVDDYCGMFLGATYNAVADAFGGAKASNGVSAEIIQGQGFLMPSIGVSFSYYFSEYGDWQYGKADINWYSPLYVPPGYHVGPEL